MKKEILIWPTNKLRKKSEPVIVFNEKLTQLIINLHQTMSEMSSKPHLPDAVGLAAPQIGVFKRVFVYKLGQDATCMINPVIIKKEGEQYESEGCMSFPGVYIKVKRADKITVEFQDVDGNVSHLKTDGFTSRCIQHEIDHLDGITFLHVLSKIKRDHVTGKMKKLKKRFEIQKKQFNEFKTRQARSEPDTGGHDIPDGQKSS